jgi:uncharacterized protein (TIGR03118 family)
MQRSSARILVLAVALVTMLVLVQGMAVAQYKVTYLDANQADKAVQPPDPNLVNAWGIARGPSTPYWVSDEMTGKSTLYTADGTRQGLVVNIPSASGTVQGTPSGIVFNGNNAFTVSEGGVSGPAFFIFATLDGTISGWNPSVDLFHAVIAVNNSASGTVYTGLAIAPDINWLYAADNAHNQVNVYGAGFNHIETLTDPTIPPGFSAYGVQVIGRTVFVTFASTGTAPGGFVDMFGEFGTFIRRFTSGGTLNQPWAIAVAPSNFGPFSNAILIGNNTPNGTISAFERKTGKFLGFLKTPEGTNVRINQLWGLKFGNGNDTTGARNQLFFTAGPQNYANGRFGVIEFVP